MFGAAHTHSSKTAASANARTPMRAPRTRAITPLSRACATGGKATASPRGAALAGARSHGVGDLQGAQVLVDAAHPFLGDLIGLHRQARLHEQTLRRGDAEVPEHAVDDGVGALGELLVGELQRLVAEPQEVGVP